MAQKWTDLSGTNSSGRLISSPRSACHLSDGTLVFIDVDWSGSTPTAYLKWAPDHASAPTTLHTLTGVATLDQADTYLAAAVDSADNIYVAGPSSSFGAPLFLQAFVKGSGHTWTPQNYGTGVFKALTRVAITWCDTGGGTSGAGHLLVLCTSNSPNNTYGIYDAGKLLTGTVQEVDDFTPQAFMGTAVATSALPMDLSNDGFGAPSGLAVTVNAANPGVTNMVVGAWAVSATGNLSMNTVVATLPSGNVLTRARLVHLSPGVWALVAPNSAAASHFMAWRCTTTTVGTGVDCATPANWPLNANTTVWDIFADPFTTGRLWVITTGTFASPNLPTWRLSCDLGSGTPTWAGAATADDSLDPVASGTLPGYLVAVKEPRGAYVDWMVTVESSATGPTYALYGDYTFFASAPSAPVLLAPANAAYVDVAAGVALLHKVAANDPSGVNAYALRVKASGGSYLYYNAATNALQSTIVWNAVTASNGDTVTVDLPTGALSNGTVYNWSAADQESGENLQGPFASDWTLNAQEAPTLSVTNPAGSVSVAYPTVTWTATPGSGASITNYRVVIYDATQYGAVGFTPGSGPSAYDSGVLSGNPGTLTLPSPLANNTSYRAYVQVTESGGESSSWQFSAFSTSFSQPAAPTVTPFLDDTTYPVPVVAVTVGANGGAGFTNPTSVTVQASDDGLDGWVPLRIGGTGQQVTTGTGSVVAYDPDATPGRTRYYRAFLTNNLQVSSDYSAAETFETVGPWDGFMLPGFDLMDPTDPSTAVALHRVAASTGSSGIGTASLVVDKPEVQGVARPLGRSTAVVMRGDMLAEEFDLAVAFYGDADASWAAFDALRDRRVTLLLRGDMPGQRWYVVLGPSRPIEIIRDGERVANPTRGLVIHCTPVDAP